MMPHFNAHGLDPSWVKPDELKVQEFFDTLHKVYVAAEARLVQDTSQEELDYVAARLREARIARTLQTFPWRTTALAGKWTAPRRKWRRRTLPGGRRPLGKLVELALGPPLLTALSRGPRWRTKGRRSRPPPLRALGGGEFCGGLPPASRFALAGPRSCGWLREW